MLEYSAHAHFLAIGGLSIRRLHGNVNSNFDTKLDSYIGDQKPGKAQK